MATLVVGVFLLTELAFTFVPATYVPSALEPLHSKLLGVRNSLIAKSGLPISRYDDAALVQSPGAPPVQIYFAPSPKIPGRLCEFVGQAKSTLDICIYDFDLNNVAEAITEASRRGVRIRVVTDSDNYGNKAIDSLIKSGIPVRPDKRQAIMHNKFIVLDASKVWTGSYNFTKNCSLKNDNDAIIVESPEIAAKYQSKFDEFWEGRFGPEANQITLDHRAMAGSMELEAAFSPSDGVAGFISSELEKAKDSVDMMAFSFTSKEIASELAKLAANGIRVRCIFDGSQAENSFSKDESLKKSNVKVKISSNHSGRMHHKTIIIDGETLITGSYNFSNNAERFNDENILLVRSRPVAEKYEEEFARCWDGTKGY